MLAFDMRIDGKVAIYGDENLHRRFPPNFRALFVSTTEDDAFAFADRCLGPFISQRGGGFAFERDQPKQWLRSVSLDHTIFVAQVEPIRWAERQLGSIVLDRFALFYSEDTFCGFWIETHELERKRVLVSEIDNGRFEGLAPDFLFTPNWLSKVITELY